MYFVGARHRPKRFTSLIFIIILRCVFLTPYFPRYKGEQEAQQKKQRFAQQAAGSELGSLAPRLWLRGPRARSPPGSVADAPYPCRARAPRGGRRPPVPPGPAAAPAPQPRGARSRCAAPRSPARASPPPRSSPGAGRPAAAGRDAQPPAGAREAIGRRGGARDTERVEPENGEAFFLGPARSGCHGVWKESPGSVCDLRGPPYR